MFLSLFRIIKFSLQDIIRNTWLSVVTVIIMVLALFTVNMLLVVKVIGQTAVEAVKEKIDVSLYLSSSADEQQILALKSKIVNLPEVSDVKYISKDEALEEFRMRYEDKPVIAETLKELGKNPLTPMLIIKPKNLDVFNNLINKIKNFDDAIIESKNFANYEEMISKINNITNKVGEAALALALIFVLVTFLVVYNSVRVAIYTHRREIKIMKLVGASNAFIEAPFIFSGVVYAVIGVSLIMLLFYPFLNLLQPYLETFFVSYNVNLIKEFFGPNIYKIFGLQLIAAIFINVVASFFAVSRYTKGWVVLKYFDVYNKSRLLFNQFLI